MDDKFELTMHGALSSIITVPLARYEELIDCETRAEVLTSMAKGHSVINTEDVFIRKGYVYESSFKKGNT